MVSIYTYSIQSNIEKTYTHLGLIQFKYLHKLRLCWFYTPPKHLNKMLGCFFIIIINFIHRKWSNVSRPLCFFYFEHLFYFVTVVLYKVSVSDDADMYSTYCMPIKMNSAKQTLKKENQQGSISYVAVTF